jgi:hypothetical protein
MVQRFHPEWLEEPSNYFPSGSIDIFLTFHEIGEKRQRRGIVSHAVFSDPLVMSFYQEALQTGVRGLGRVGIEDLRLLLTEEHPDLMEGHEISS